MPQCHDGLSLVLLGFMELGIKQEYTNAVNLKLTSEDNVFVVLKTKTTMRDLLPSQDGRPLQGEVYTKSDLSYRPKSTATRGTMHLLLGLKQGYPLHSL